MIHSFIYQPGKPLEMDVSHDVLAKRLADTVSIVWVDLEQPTSEETKILSDVFRFHPLAIEDCTNISHYPKIDTFDDYLFIVLHAINQTAPQEELSTLELNVFLSTKYVVTYHTRAIKSIIQAKQRCAKDPAAIMEKGADFLAYTIMDSLVDNFIPTLNTLDYRIDQMEDEIFVDSPHVLNKIMTIRNDIIYLRKVIRPQRNILNQLTRGNPPFIHKDNMIYFRDIYDQLYRITEQSDGYRDMISGVLDTHLSLTSYKMNQIMKSLTIVATIMMPLTLITGIYGMNFHFMPETQSRWGYFAVLGLMTVIAGSIITYMKKKKWF